MPFRLILAEKPSVARDIAKVLSVRQRHDGWLGDDRLRVTWCVGHLVELAEPDAYDSANKRWSWDTLPLDPKTFRLQPREGSKDQWTVVRDLLRDKQLVEVVNACDAGREGELIFAYAYELAGCRAPVRRLWISSMTDAAIAQGFERLRDGQAMAPLEAAARCRSEADWLVGLNATRAMTLKAREAGAGALLSLGRVQTPTLALLVDREDAIDAFVPEPFWQVLATLESDAGRWTATWFEEQGKERVERLTDPARAEAIAAAVRAAATGAVTRVVRKEKAEPPPLLYDLTTLQKEANARFRFPAARTLEIAQALYEKHKLLSYPRTDSRHLGSDQVPLLPGLVESLAFGPYQATAEQVRNGWPPPLGRRVVDDAEVSDHHAIIPTGRDPRGEALDRDAKRIFDLVARRFLAVFLPPARFATAEVDAELGGERFGAKGRTLLDPGWQAIDPPRGDRKEVLLPPVETGDAARAVEVELKEGRTQPPKRYTEATLLGAMERAGEALDDDELKRAMKRSGLGTPATRAAIIETLLHRGYIARQDPVVVPTPAGRALLALLPVPELRSARLTGAWEARLAAMAEGEDDRAAFMAELRAFSARIVATIRDATLDRVASGQLPAPVEAGGEPLGACPRCGQPVTPTRWGWSCVCGLRIPGRLADREVSERMAKALLKDGATKPVQGWKSKAGKRFTAGLKLVDGQVQFDFPQSEALGACPKCAAPVRARGKVFACDTGRECPFVLFATMAGRAFTEDEVRALLRDGRLPRLHGFAKKDGGTFAAGVVLDDERGVRFDFGAKDAVPEGGPPPAFGAPVDCPACRARGDTQVGYVIAGKSAWGCARWKAGCGLRVPFEILGVTLGEEQGARLFRQGETVLMALPIGAGGVAVQGRIRLMPGTAPWWEAVRRSG